MPRKRKSDLTHCVFFQWRLSKRSGVWYADGRSNNPSAGRHSLGTRDKDEAKRLLPALDRQRAEDLGLAPKTARTASEADLLPLDEGREIYQKHYSRPLVAGGVAPGTQKRYRAAFDKFVAFAKERGVTTWNGVSNQLLIDYAAHLEQTEYAPGKTYLPKTICDDITTIKQCVRHLVQEGRLANVNPIDIKLCKPESERHYCWRQEEVQAVVELTEKTPSLQWLHAVIVGLAHSGLRISELASLRWRDLDLESKNPVIRLTDERGHRSQNGRAKRTVKNRHSRSFPIHAKWAEVLKRLPQVDAYVYHGPRGGRLKPDTARIALKDHVIKPLTKRFPSRDGERSFKDGRFHSFRHYFCSTCANNGVPERVVMNWLGHQDSEMIKYYYHLHDDESRRQMDQLNFLGGGSGRSANEEK